MKNGKVVIDDNGYISIVSPKHATKNKKHDITVIALCAVATLSTIGLLVCLFGKLP